MEQHIKIVLVGEKGVGKTSLITTFVASTFEEKVAPTIPPVLIPHPKENGHVRTEIIDTSSRDSDQHQVEEQIKHANFICIVYDVNVIQTKQAVFDYWIPKIRKLRDKVPFALIGAKTDIRDAKLHHKRTCEDLKAEMNPVMHDYNNIEFVLECSAKGDPTATIDELFWYAQQGVLYPRMPLCDANLNLTTEFVTVLRRIFRLIDGNKDGYLNDFDLKVLQQVCFGEALDDGAVAQIKDSLKAQDPDAVGPHGVTLRGFIVIFHIMLERGRREPIWTILRHYGYDNTLQIHPKYCCPDVAVPEGSRVELSRNGISFLHRTFMVYQQRQSRAPQAQAAGILTRYKLNQLFSVVPEGGQHPWRIFDFPDCCPVLTTLPADLTVFEDEDATADNTSVSANSVSTLSSLDSGLLRDVVEDRIQDSKYEAVTLDSFLAMWAMTTLYDYKTALRYISYIGYDPHQAATTQGENVVNTVASAVSVTKQRERTVFLAYVIGSAGSGKTSLVQSFVGKEFTEATAVASSPITRRQARTKFGVNKLKNSSHLVLEIVDINIPSTSGNAQPEVTKPLNPGAMYDVNTMNKCDVILLVFDQSSVASFRHAAHAFLQIEKTNPHIPCIFVANKSDLPSFTKQGTTKVIYPQEFCRKHGLKPPISVSVKNKQLNNVFDEAVEAVRTNLGRRRMERKTRERQWGFFLRIGGSLALFVSLALGFLMVWKQYSWQQIRAIQLRDIFGTQHTPTIKFS